MIKFLPYTLKTLWRHRSRTILTVTGSATAMFVFCCVSSIQQGMHELQSRQASQNSLIVFQANRFCPATSHLPQDYGRQISDLPGVRRVMPLQVFTNNCRASLDVVVFYGIPPRQLRQARDFQLIDGNWDDFENHQDSAVVGEAVAARRNLRTGGKFTLGELTITVAGIYTSDDPGEEHYIYTHLDFLQRAKGMDLVGTVTQLEVQLHGNVDPQEKCDEIDTLLENGPVSTDTRPKGVFQADSLGDLTQLVELTRYLGYACVGLVLALVAATTVMSVQDRMAEHAVLQTLGFSGKRIFSLILSESVLLSVTGGIIGVAAATVTLHVSNFCLGAEAVTVTFSPSTYLAIVALVISAGTGLVAGVAPAWQAARTEIITGLRQA